ncbi:unnamed protein product [Tetraodon nigroviridis]|uniref:(spotted green pufferfish) hypothetical protein n=1 Tax=Tetraodon nigroviridis TaxID=99883 RepID=Q4S343_TETNG|nr:unnamed protein product [Tetraodon nigroviridis]
MTDDMKPTHMLLFVLCPTLVLGFIYYSSRKLHLPAWGQKTRKCLLPPVALPGICTPVSTCSRRKPPYLSHSSFSIRLFCCLPTCPN